MKLSKTSNSVVCINNEIDCFSASSNFDLFSGGSSKNNPADQHDVLSDDIYDKLFGLVEYDKKQKRKTRKYRPDIDNVPISITTSKKTKKTRKK